MPCPRSWAEVYACKCGECAKLASIHRRCVQLEEPLYVTDCRMFGRGFVVVDSRKLFVEVPAAVIENFESPLKATAFVLDRQQHCDALMSSYPVQWNGDWRWSVESYLRQQEVSSANV